MRGSITRCFRLVTEASEKNRNRHEEILPVPENLPFIAFLPPDISAGFFFCGLMPLRANLSHLRTFAAAFWRFYYQNRAATRRFTSAPSALPLTLGISSFIMRPLSCGAGFSMPSSLSTAAISACISCSERNLGANSVYTASLASFTAIDAFYASIL